MKHSHEKILYLTLAGVLFLFAISRFLSLPGPTQGEEPLNRVLFLVSTNEANRPITDRTTNLLKDILVSHWEAEVDLTDFDPLSDGLPSISGYDLVLAVEDTSSLLSTNMAHAMLDSSVPLFLFNHRWYDLSDEPDTEIAFNGLSFSDQFKVGSGLLFSEYLSTDRDEVNTEHLAFLKGPNVEQVLVARSGNLTLLPFPVPKLYATDSYTTVLLALIGDELESPEWHHEKRALLRLEDVNPYVYRNSDLLTAVFDYLRGRGVHVHSAFFPLFIDRQREIEFGMNDAPEVIRLHKQMIEDELLTLVLHGFTHQYQDEISGEGHEFWDGRNSGPVVTDTYERHEERVLRALSMIEEAGLGPVDIWESPHYAYSDNANKVFMDYFPYRYERLIGVGSLPFAVELTVNNIRPTRLIPENLGYVFEAETQDDVDAIIKRFEQLSVVPGSTPSFFWHPWRDIDELRQLVEFFLEEEYKFVSAYELFEHIERR